MNSNLAAGQNHFTGGRGRAAWLVWLPVPGETVWLTAVVAAFLLLHVVAGVICLRASAAEAAAHLPSESAVSLYD
jgi:hypothetical protein